MNPPPLRRRALIAAAAALAAPAGRAAPDDPTGGPIDLMPAFWRAYDDARGRPAAERAAWLLRRFFAPNAALYRRAGWTDAPQAADVLAWLARLDPLAADAKALHARFASEVRAHAERFRTALTDFDPAASPVFVLPSLMRFEARLEPDGASLPLFFAPDGITRSRGRGPDLGVLVAHELFHAYQCQRNPLLFRLPDAPLFTSLWSEGTATWASSRLNPRAAMLHVLLDDEALLRDGRGAAPVVAQAMLDKLDAVDEVTRATFFDAGWRGEGWPARAGVYVGYLVAARLGADGMTLSQAVALPPRRVRDQVADILRAVAAGRA